MISLLLLNPVLSDGSHGAIEAGIGAVLERINNTDGSVCHEETIGYALTNWRRLMRIYDSNSAVLMQRLRYLFK